MMQIYEGEHIRSVLEYAATKIKSDSIAEGWHGVAVETTGNDCKFEGTLLYFPGVKLKELMQ